ncbi:hypothetical protein [Azospirillum doebereinerae]|uniref:Uncharacterized protein n=1 Tax=Azospirillum doebereinerae TaxID=92933 RepID=A0A433IZP4_9PROT|nr:hypothetical protein [Azospirillum doebereinerae]RUQ61245.1 hypothetical protein EJ913_30040 [Azospirillum doebereinerae]
MTATTNPERPARYETQASILTWERHTFGPSTPMQTLARAADELAGLFDAVATSSEPERIVGKATAAALALVSIGELLGTTDWLFGGREPRMYRPARLVGYTLTQLGLLTFDVELVSTGDPARSQSVALRNLRAVVGALRELVGCYGRDLTHEVDRAMAAARALQKRRAAP